MINAAAGLLNIKNRRYKTRGSGEGEGGGGDGTSKFKKISSFIFTEDVLTGFKKAR